MSKKIIITLSIIVIIIIIVALSFWYFSRTNSTINQLNGVTAKVKSSEKSITSFAFSGLNLQGSEVIDSTSHTVTLVVPSGTDVTSLTPIISVPYDATISPNSGVTQDFTNPVVYTVTAQDGSTQNYTVIVKIATPEGTGGS